MAFTVDSIGFVLLLLLLALVFLGIWPALWKYLDIKGKNPTHTFLDYGLCYIFVGTAASLIGSQLEYAGGSMPSFADQIRRNSGSLVMFAIGGGAALAIGDLLLQYSVLLIGVTLAPSISASVVNAVAIVLSYFIDKGLNDPKYVFSGLSCSIVAIVLGSLTQYVHERTTGEVNFVDVKYADVTDLSSSDARLKLDTELQLDTKSEPSADRSTVQLSQTAATRRTVIRGLTLSVVSGVLTGVYVPAFSISCNDPLGLLQSPQQQPMSVYVAYMYFALAVGITAVATNVVLLYKPVPGCPRSSLTQYLLDNKHRLASVGAGVVVSSSVLLQFVGGQHGGYAAAMLSGAFPLVTTLIGVFVFREFRSARPGTVVLLAATCGFYIGSVVLLGLSARPREA